MEVTDPHCHTCSCQVDVAARVAFDYLADGLKQSEWTFGSWNRRQVADDLFVGTSMFDDRDTYVKIDTDPNRFLIYYHIGPDPEHLQARNMVRVMPGIEIGRQPEICLVTLMAWRSTFMDDDRWKQLCVSHETQMFIIKSRLETQSQVAPR